MANTPVRPSASSPRNVTLRKTIFALAIPLATVMSGVIGIVWLATLSYLEPVVSLIGSVGACLFGLFPMLPAILFLGPGKDALTLGNKVIGLTLLAVGLAWIHLVIIIGCVSAFELLLSQHDRPAVAAELFWYYCCILIPFLCFNSMERSAAGESPTIGAYIWNGSAVALTAMVIPHFFMKARYPVADIAIFSAISLGAIAYELMIIARTPDVVLTDII